MTSASQWSEQRWSPCPVWVDPLSGTNDHLIRACSLRYLIISIFQLLFTVNMYIGICPHSRRSNALSTRELLR